LFELVIYFFFSTTAFLAFKKHGKNVLILFGMIIVIALSIEIPAISNNGYDYLNFIIYIANYPIALPLGWCVFFYWAHTFSEAIIEWDGSLLRALILAGITGILTGSMSLFLEPGGQALGWWLYHGPGASGLVWFDVPIEINLTYYVWGAFDAFVFRMFMYKEWLQRTDLSPPILQHYPAFCSLIFFGLMVITVIGVNQAELLLLFPNVTMWAIIYIFRYKGYYPLSFHIPKVPIKAN
jgi:hypothetical protein